MGFWNALSKLADILQVVTAAIPLMFIMSKAYRNLPKDRVRYFLRQAHDPMLVIFLVLVQSVLSLQIRAIPPLIALGITLVVIPLPLLITLWYLRKPMGIERRLRILAFAPVFAVAFYVNVLIVVCTLSIAFNQSVANILAYLSVPNQLVQLLPGMFAWALTISLILPVVWVLCVPRIKAKSYTEVLNRLKR